MSILLNIFTFEDRSNSLCNIPANVGGILMLLLLFFANLTTHLLISKVWML